jgi:DNA-binding LytR/AlgR family response regulator
MQILLIEDEIPAYKRLKQMVLELVPLAQISTQIDSISAALRYLQTAPRPDLIFMDIQLADGLSFSIFGQFDVQTPVIFTTAFDQYAVKAFKVHSIDYLLKPIEEEALVQALDKYQRYYRQAPPALSQPTIQQLVQQLQQPTYRERFLVKTGSSLAYLKAEEVAYLYSDQSLVFARKTDGKQHHLDATLDQLEVQLDPTLFFRISRKAIIHLQAIRKIDNYFNGRLLLELQPAADFQTTVSRDRVNDFKAWLDGEV